MKTEAEIKAETLALLDQFGQVILYGPPGTGKTRAALHVAAALLGKEDAKALLVEDNPSFAFVQFHPSYNYEDFVRGIRMETDDNKQVVYKTENRVFGKMAEKAAEAAKVAEAAGTEAPPYVLVIDEINRANVSAVLGELIYGLEYRDQKVQTPYEIIGGGYGLTVPPNLKVIGTMNTADRTIGQIDYAVRRRFAFVHCAPIDTVREEVQGIYEDVARLFVDFLSPDYDVEDVEIGHSYFLVDENTPNPVSQLKNKIIYQVVPILREYLKDGVLGKEAKPKIDAIREAAKDLGKSERVDEAMSDNKMEKGAGVWRWTHVASDTRHEPKNPRPNISPYSLRRMILSLVRHYAMVSGTPQNLKELQDAFPKECAWCHEVALSIEDDRVEKSGNYLSDEEAQIALPDGTIAVVCGEWGATGDARRPFLEFKRRALGLGYEIRRDRSTVMNDVPYWAVNVGERRHRPHRDWDNCRQYGFLSGGQDDAPAKYLGQIPRGAIVFAYISGFGYVGCGKVMDEATTIGEFLIGENFKPLSDVLDAATPHDDHDPEKEFAIRVKWLGTPRAREQGVLSKYSYPRTASPIQDAERLRALKSEFGIADENDGAN